MISADGQSDVVVQLFQWNWPSIAAECTERIGPAGYGYVQTSPPQEEVVGPQWWTSYQPVSYKIDSRLGTRAEFAAMVQACHAAGVKVIVDAVLNHMTGQEAPGVGFAGSPFSHYDYPGLYSSADFHHCGRNGTDDIQHYQDAVEVQTCELLNLADLDTGSAHVQATLQAYLADLLSLGADGFRIDAAKHIAPADLAAVLSTLPPGTKIIQEVIRGGGEPVTPEQYVALGQVQEFAFAREVSSFFRNGQMFALQDYPIPGLTLPSDAAITFIDNHDTERNGETLNYADGRIYLLANLYLLGTSYGSPAVYSGYTFAQRDDGPPQDASGLVLDASCGSAKSGPWTCFHTEPAVVGMVGFHNATAGAAISDVTVDGSALRFARGNLGSVVLNAGPEPYLATVQSTLAPGDYCDVIHGALSAGSCSGPIITVAADGSFAVAIDPWDAVAVHVGAALGR